MGLETRIISRRINRFADDLSPVPVQSPSYFGFMGGRKRGRPKGSTGQSAILGPFFFPGNEILPRGLMAAGFRRQLPRSLSRNSIDTRWNWQQLTHHVLRRRRRFSRFLSRINPHGERNSGLMVVVYRVATGPVVSNELDMSPIYSDCLIRRASGIFSKIDGTASSEPTGTETFVNASTNFIL